MGVKNIQKNAAIVDALSVFIEILKSLVIWLWSRISKVSLFEKVSPNLDNGPYNKATEYPLWNLLTPPSAYNLEATSLKRPPFQY